MMRPLCRCSLYFDQGIDFHCCGNGLEDPSDGCEDRISQWNHTGGGVCGVNLKDLRFMGESLMCAG